MSNALAMYLMVLLNCNNLGPGETCVRTNCTVTKTYDSTGSLTINGCAIEIVVPDLIEIRLSETE